jgi:hypothetical protein
LNLAYPEEVLNIWLHNYINILINPTGVAKFLMRYFYSGYESSFSSAEPKKRRVRN